MKVHFSARFRQFARRSEGSTMIEFALVFPIVLMITFGIMEISLCMASLVTLEGGLKEASRYGITSQNPTPAQLAALAGQIPPKFAGASARKKMIVAIINTHALDLIDLNDAEVDDEIFDSFSVVKNGEPYNDLPDIPIVGNPPNGHYDPPGTPGFPPGGEPYSDMNCNGGRDGPGAAASGTGSAGDIVVYTVIYSWKIMTPIIGQWLGSPDPDNPGRYEIPMSARIVVKNEPDLSGNSFCKAS
jgi:hypothetical protein